MMDSLPKRPGLCLFSLALVATGCPTSDGEGAGTTAEASASTSTGAENTGTAGPACPTAPIEFGTYFKGAIGEETRLLNGLTVSDDCSWSFDFVDCDDTQTSVGLWEVDGDSIRLSNTDGSDGVLFVDGVEVTEIIISPGPTCDDITVQYLNDTGGTDMEPWSRGEGCLSGPSCCTDCTMPPPTPSIEYCEGPPDEC